MSLLSLEKKIKYLERELRCSTCSNPYYSPFEEFPEIGKEDRLYVDTENNVIYLWDGTQYVQISGSSGGIVNIGDDTETTLPSGELLIAGNDNTIDTIPANTYTTPVKAQQITDDAITSLKDGVPSDGDTLNELYLAIQQNAIDIDNIQSSGGLSLSNKPIQVDSVPQITDGVFLYNSVSYIQDNIIIYKNYIYITYIARGRKPMIGKRLLNGGDWEIFDLSTIAGVPFGTTVDPDSHNIFIIGMDKNGRLHITGGMHNTGLKYVYCNNIADINGNVNITSWTSASMTGVAEASVTYPAFVRLADEEMLFFYRDGSSGNGNLRLKRLNATTNIWSDIGIIMNGVSSSQSPYIDPVQVDATTGRIHMFGCWRSTPAPNTNNDVFYLYSDDDGVTWRDSSNVLLTLPVNYSNSPTILDTTDTLSGLLNQSGTSVDTQGRPHKAFLLDDGSNNTQIYHLWYDGTIWHNDLVTNFKFGNNDSGSSDVLGVSSRPNIISTDDGRTFVVCHYRSEKGSIRMIDVTPSIDGLPNWGEFPIVNIDYNYAEPLFSSWNRRDNSLVMLVNDSTQRISSDLTSWTASSHWWQTMGHIIILQQNDIRQLATGISNPPRINVISSAGMTKTTATVTSSTTSTSAVPDLPRLVIPSGYGRKSLCVRVRGNTISTAVGGTLSIALIPQTGLGTETKINIPSSLVLQTFETTWIPIDMTIGTWNNGGIAEIRGLVSSGQISVQSCSIDLGIVVDTLGTPVRAALNNVSSTVVSPVASTLPNIPVGTWSAKSLVLSDGAEITSLPDTSGSGNTMTQATSSARPIYDADGINGFPAMVFAGGDFLSAATLAIGSKFTVFVVCSYDNVAPSTQTVASQDVGGTNRLWQMAITSSTSLTSNVFNTSGSPTSDNPGVVASTTVPFIYELVSTDTSVEVFYNGVTNGATTRLGSPSTSTATPIIGGRLNSGTIQSDSFRGKVGEVRLIAGTLTAGERTIIRNELAASFGINL